MADCYAYDGIIPGYFWRSMKEPPRVEDHGWSSGWIYLESESDVLIEQLNNTHTHTKVFFQTLPVTKPITQNPSSICAG